MSGRCARLDIIHRAVAVAVSSAESHCFVSLVHCILSKLCVLWHCTLQGRSRAGLSHGQGTEQANASSPYSFVVTYCVTLYTATSCRKQHSWSAARAMLVHASFFLTRSDDFVHCRPAAAPGRPAAPAQREPRRAAPAESRESDAGQEAPGAAQLAPPSRGAGRGQAFVAPTPATPAARPPPRPGGA